MSPRELPVPPPRASRAAVVVYAICGVVGAFGLFAAVQDAQQMQEEPPVAIDPVVAVAPVESVNPLTLVGVWKAGEYVLVLDAAGTGSMCPGGTFDWRVEDHTVRFSASGFTLEVRGQTLVAGDLVFVPVQDLPGGGAL